MEIDTLEKKRNELSGYFERNHFSVKDSLIVCADLARNAISQFPHGKARREVFNWFCVEIESNLNFKENANDRKN